jgi:hypothetical protein
LACRQGAQRLDCHSRNWLRPGLQTLRALHSSGLGLHLTRLLHLQPVELLLQGQALEPDLLQLPLHLQPRGSLQLHVPLPTLHVVLLLGQRPFPPAHLLPLEMIGLL